MYWILFVGIALVSYLVQSNLKRKFEEYFKSAGCIGNDWSGSC